jgi:glyoxylase-like metal-dependent hydrolase (beta-lactamase superfamily II)
MRKDLAVGLAVAAAVLTGAAVVRAQVGGEQTSPPRAAAPIQLQALTPNVYWAVDGSNVGVIVGNTGVVVFDTGGSPARAKELLADIAKITPKPVDTVILSHGDGDHVGGLPAFPAGIRIIAQASTAKALAANAGTGKGQTPPAYLPNQTVSDREDKLVDGVRMQLLHWAPAHTVGDLVLYLPDQKIVFSGDIFCLDQARAFVKPEQGGSVEGWIKSARGVLALDARRIVVGHGGVETKASLKAFVDTSVAERDQVTALADKGETLQQIAAEVNEPPKSPTAPPHFVPYYQVIYEEATARR